MKEFSNSEIDKGFYSLRVEEEFFGLLGYTLRPWKIEKDLLRKYVYVNLSIHDILHQHHFAEYENLKEYAEPYGIDWCQITSNGYLIHSDKLPCLGNMIETDHPYNGVLRMLTRIYGQQQEFLEKL